MTNKKRGGWNNPASANNGKSGGRPRRKLVRWHGEEAVVLRDGDTVSVIDATGPRLATVHIHSGMLLLTNETGQKLRIIVSE